MESGAAADDMRALEARRTASGACAPEMMLLDLNRLLAAATASMNETLAVLNRRMRTRLIAVNDTGSLDTSRAATANVVGGEGDEAPSSRRIDLQSAGPTTAAAAAMPSTEGVSPQPETRPRGFRGTDGEYLENALAGVTNGAAAAAAIAANDNNDADADEGICPYDDAGPSSDPVSASADQPAGAGAAYWQAHPVGWCASEKAVDRVM